MSGTDSAAEQSASNQAFGQPPAFLQPTAATAAAPMLPSVKSSLQDFAKAIATMALLHEQNTELRSSMTKLHSLYQSETTRLTQQTKQLESLVQQLQAQRDGARRESRELQTFIQKLQPELDMLRKKAGNSNPGLPDAFSGASGLLDGDGQSMKPSETRPGSAASSTPATPTLSSATAADGSALQLATKEQPGRAPPAGISSLKQLYLNFPMSSLEPAVGICSTASQRILLSFDSLAIRKRTEGSLMCHFCDHAFDDPLLFFIHQIFPAHVLRTDLAESFSVNTNIKRVYPLERNELQSVAESMSLFKKLSSGSKNTSFVCDCCGKQTDDAKAFINHCRSQEHLVTVVTVIANLYSNEENQDGLQFLRCILDLGLLLVKANDLTASIHMLAMKETVNRSTNTPQDNNRMSELTFNHMKVCRQYDEACCEVLAQSTFNPTEYTSRVLPEEAISLLQPRIASSPGLLPSTPTAADATAAGAQQAAPAADAAAMGADTAAAAAAAARSAAPSDLSDQGPAAAAAAAATAAAANAAAAAGLPVPVNVGEGVAPAAAAPDAAAAVPVHEASSDAPSNVAATAADGADGAPSAVAGDSAAADAVDAPAAVEGTAPAADQTAPIAEGAVAAGAAPALVEPEQGTLVPASSQQPLTPTQAGKASATGLLSAPPLGTSLGILNPSDVPTSAPSVPLPHLIAAEQPGARSTTPTSAVPQANSLGLQSLGGIPTAPPTSGLARLAPGPLQSLGQNLGPSLLQPNPQASSALPTGLMPTGNPLGTSPLLQDLQAQAQSIPQSQGMTPSAAQALNNLVRGTMTSNMNQMSLLQPNQGGQLGQMPSLLQQAPHSMAQMQTAARPLDVQIGAPQRDPIVSHMGDLRGPTLGMHQQGGGNMQGMSQWMNAGAQNPAMQPTFQQRLQMQQQAQPLLGMQRPGMGQQQMLPPGGNQQLLQPVVSQQLMQSMQGQQLMQTTLGQQLMQPGQHLLQQQQNQLLQQQQNQLQNQMQSQMQNQMQSQLQNQMQGQMQLQPTQQQLLQQQGQQQLLQQGDLGGVGQRNQGLYGWPGNVLQMPPNSMGPFN